MDATDDRGRPVDLAALEPGEATVRVLRGTLRYVPDHVAAAQASRRLLNWDPAKPGDYQCVVAMTDGQRACLEGGA